MDLRTTTYLVEKIRVNNPGILDGLTGVNQLLGSDGANGAQGVNFTDYSYHGLQLSDLSTGAFHAGTGGGIFYDSTAATFSFSSNSGDQGVLVIPTGSAYVAMAIPGQNNAIDADASFSGTTYTAPLSMGLTNVNPFTFELWLHITADASGGYKLKFESDNPSDVEFITYEVRACTASTGATNVFGVRTALSTVDSETGPTAVTVNIRGTAKLTSGASTFPNYISLNMAKNVAAGGNTLLKKGSYIKFAAFA